MARLTQYIWLFSLFTHAACNGCKQQEIPIEEDLWGANVSIDDSDGIALQGSINGYPLLTLQGEIAKNVPGVDTAFLCAIFVPKGQEIDEIGKKMQRHVLKQGETKNGNDALELKKLQPVGENCFVYYDRALQPKEIGTVQFSVPAFEPRNGLMFNTHYQAFLGIKVGPHVFYTKENCGHFQLPDTDTITKINMNTATGKRVRNTDATKTPRAYTTLSAEASITNLASSGEQKVGFLCLKHGTGLTPLEVCKAQITSNKAWPTNANTLTAYPDNKVVVCPTTLPGSTSGTTTIDIAVNDPKELLEKGISYDVYAYCAKDDKDFFFSESNKQITIPAVEIEVRMEKVGDPQLIAAKNSSTSEYTVHEFFLNLEGTITKLKNADEPIAGFVFVRKGYTKNKDNIKEAIGACSNTLDIGDVRLPSTSDNPDAKNYVVCVAQKDVRGTDKISLNFDLKDAQNTSYLDLKHDYDVYCWVADNGGAGEIFLSDTVKELKLFYAEGAGIVALNNKCNYVNRYTLEIMSNVSLLRNGAEVKNIVMFVPSLDAPYSYGEDLKTIRTKVQEESFTVDMWWSMRLSHYLIDNSITLPPTYVFRQMTHLPGHVDIIVQSNHVGNLLPQKVYKAYLVQVQGNVIYRLGECDYTTPKEFLRRNGFCWPISDKKITLQDIAELQLENVDAFIGNRLELDSEDEITVGNFDYFSSVYLVKKEGGKSINKIELNPTNDCNRKIIRKALTELFRESQFQKVKFRQYNVYDPEIDEGITGEDGILYPHIWRIGRE